jgi:RNase P subunit RPR2
MMDPYRFVCPACVKTVRVSDEHLDCVDVTCPECGEVTSLSEDDAMRGRTLRDVLPRVDNAPSR